MFKNKGKIILISLISMITCLLTILFILKLVNFSLVTGYILGSCFLFFSLFFMKLGIKNLIDNLNPYSYMFITTLRIGFYIVPFLISFYLPNIFNIYGLVIAFIVNWIPSVYFSKAK
ncbi:MG406 family protein [Spiroplasma endosymbiont of Cantharis lateralis]|uniref:MG406 family protein n=1 Tax=Spiroplasma endosymbiont of Cantharis lateralis TaxID=3066277 RepID=UPI003CC79D91